MSFLVKYGWSHKLAREPALHMHSTPAASRLLHLATAGVPFPHDFPPPNEGFGRPPGAPGFTPGPDPGFRGQPPQGHHLPPPGPTIVVGPPPPGAVITVRPPPGVGGLVMHNPAQGLPPGAVVVGPPPMAPQQQQQQQGLRPPGQIPGGQAPMFVPAGVMDARQQQQQQQGRLAGPPPGASGAGPRPMHSRPMHGALVLGVVG
jgi:hypothetical protein